MWDLNKILYYLFLSETVCQEWIANWSIDDFRKRFSLSRPLKIIKSLNPSGIAPLQFYILMKFIQNIQLIYDSFHR